METRAVELFGTVEPLEVRSDDKGTVIGGYAARFNVRSRDLGGFTEVLQPGTFTASLASGREVRALVAHDPDKILSRTGNKTLRVWEDERGLRFEAQVPPVSYGNDLLELIKRGTIAGCSFGFIARSDEFKMDAGQTVRHIKSADLFEVSLVATPAYDATSVSIRIDPAVIRKISEPTLTRNAHLRRLIAAQG